MRAFFERFLLFLISHPSLPYIIEKANSLQSRSDGANNRQTLISIPIRDPVELEFIDIHFWRGKFPMFLSELQLSDNDHIGLS